MLHCNTFLSLLPLLASDYPASHQSCVLSPLPSLTLPIVCSRAGWHQLKHGTLAARAKKDDKRSLGELIRASCKVRPASQFPAPPAAVPGIRHPRMPPPWVALAPESALPGLACLACAIADPLYVPHVVSRLPCRPPISCWARRRCSCWRLLHCTSAWAC